MTSGWPHGQMGGHHCKSATNVPACVFVFSLSTLAADDGSQAQGGPSSGTQPNSAFVHAMKQLIGALDRILPNASQLQG